MTLLAKIIDEMYKTKDIRWFVIHGEAGSGKTSYALWSLYEIYGDFDKVLDHLFFDINSVIKRIEKAIERGERLKAIILDDFGSEALVYRWREKEIQHFIRIMNLSRSFVAGVIITAIDLYDILKRLRVKAHYLIKVKKISGSIEVNGFVSPLSKAIIYRQRYSTGYDDYYRRGEGEEEFPRYYPCLDKYEEKRTNYLFKLIKEYKKDKEKIEEHQKKTISLFRIICPRCGERGILMLTKQKYFYCKHGKKEKCYLGTIELFKKKTAVFLKEKEE